jgi:glycosyltransferase involved in cell wall biosynthesis
MRDEIKILNIITRLNIGGSTRHVLEITRHFNQGGYRSAILYGNVEPNEQDMLYLMKEYGLEGINLPSMGRSINLIQDLLLIPKVWKIIRKLKPDIVHTHTAKAGMAGRVAARLAGVPVVLHTFHGNNFRGYFGKIMTQVSINIERVLARLSTKIIAISELQREELLHFRICKDAKIQVINLGFDLRKITHSDADVGTFKSAFSIAGNWKVVDFVGRLTAIKDPFRFIEIARRVIASRDDVVFVFAGDGELADDLKERVRSHGLQERIIFTGYITDLRPLYADTDVLLLTSVNEGTPVAVIEAMANRIPVVATRVGGVPNLIKHKHTGFLFESKDMDGMAQAVLSIIQDPAYYLAITDNAYTHISTCYSSTRLIHDLDSLFQQTLIQTGKKKAIS